eukprot:1194377-Prorocentrum_minimum.AAC.3
MRSGQAHLLQQFQGSSSLLAHADRGRDRDWDRDRGMPSNRGRWASARTPSLESSILSTAGVLHPPTRLPCKCPYAHI